MKATRKVLSVLLTLAMVLTFFCGLTTTAYAEEATGVRLEAERDGDTLKLNVLLNEELNFGGMSFVGYPTCDVEGVFTFEDMTTSVSGFSVEKGTWPSVTTGQDITLPKDTVFVTFTYSIDTTKFEEGKVYTFTCQLDQACHFDVEDLYDWGEDTLTTTYSEAATTYTITWVDEDGTELEKDENVPAGTMPTYDGAEPTKAADAQYTYSFAGWDPEVVAVTEDATYTATYDKTLNTYTVTWKNYDGSVLETDENVPYGTTPTYNGETPVKPADEQNTYTFAGWDPAVAPVEGNVEYTAKFTSEEITYHTLTFKNADGSVLTTKQVAHGQKLTDYPTVEAPEGQYFKGWAVEAKLVRFINVLRGTGVFDFANTAIEEDMTFTPVFENKGVDLSSIVITKVLEGDEYDGEEPMEFTFNITPVDGAPAIEGTFKVSTDGELTVTLPENVIFEQGGTYTYEVTEQDDGAEDWTYDTTKYIMELLIEPQNTDGKLGLTYAKIHKDGETDKEATLTFTNTYKIKVAPLTIMNLNTDNVVEGTKFAYSIVFNTTFTDTKTNITYTKDQSVDLGELGDDESVTINNIPVGTEFTITEAAGGEMYSHKRTDETTENITANESPVTGADLVLTGKIVEDPNAKAPDPKPANYAEIENDLVYETGTLKINKVVDGEIDPAYTDKEYSFTITFTVPEEFANIKILDKDGNEVDGTVTFTLKAGESYEKFTNIPVGTTYTLTEAAEQYFVATYKTENGDEGGNTEANKEMKAEGIEIVKDDNAITVTNTYTITPPTGVTIHTEMILILALVLIAMIGSVVLTKKLRRA